VSWPGADRERRAKRRECFLIRSEKRLWQIEHARQDETCDRRGARAPDGNLPKRALSARSDTNGQKRRPLCRRPWRIKFDDELRAVRVREVERFDRSIRSVDAKSARALSGNATRAKGSMDADAAAPTLTFRATS